MVYNPDKAGNDVEAGDWFDEFVKSKGLVDQCLVLAHHPSSSTRAVASRVPAKIKVANLGVVETGFDSGSATIVAQNFDDFLAKCVASRKR